MKLFSKDVFLLNCVSFSSSPGLNKESVTVSHEDLARSQSETTKQGVDVGVRAAGDGAAQRHAGVQGGFRDT